MRKRERGGGSWDALSTTALYVGADCIQMVNLQRVFVALSNVKNIVRIHSPLNARLFLAFTN